MEANMVFASPYAIARYMTPSPHSVGRDQPLATARALMNKYSVRHLPVLDGGKLAGILSQRDLYFVESLTGVDDAARVDEAMSPEAYVVRPETPLSEVAHEMKEHKYGCAVVMDRGKVVGVFTTTDACAALCELLRAR